MALHVRRHTHPGAPVPGEPLDEVVLRDDLVLHRAFLGLPGLDEGAPADFVVYDRDPLADLSVLDHPAHVVLDGQLVRTS